jgi:GNAT superfamily N-acetyltransferase
MSDAWMPSLRIPMLQQDFDQLPRHPAYQYEYLGGAASLAPWPRYYHAQLDLAPLTADPLLQATAPLKPARPQDIEAMVPVFDRAFAHLQPFGSLLEEHRRLAAEQSLRLTFGGEDGPLIEPASLIAWEEEKIIGAILLTLLPGGLSTAWDSYHWLSPPPMDLWEVREGQPHLTWIFVDRVAQGTGIGTQLLHTAARVLRDNGYLSLWTTFMVGNESSLLWHWRNGFRLLPHAHSKRNR